MPKPIRLLLVEDCAGDAELILREVRRAGFDPVIRRADNEPDYLGHLDAELDLVISDYRLPQFDGMRALELLQARGLAIPFILVSGTIGEDTAVEAMKKGAADYLLKDRLARLGPAIVQALEQAQMRRERQLAMEALRWRTAFFEAQVDCALDGILVVDSAERKILQNRRLNDLWKIPVEIAGSGDDRRQIEFITRQVKNPRAFAESMAYLYAHPDEVGRDEIELRDGTILDRYSAPVRDKAGRNYGRIWTFRDVTEERKREQRLTEALSREKELVREAQAGNRAKGEFLAVMSHEIRTPMNGILGFAELLAGTPELPTGCQESVQTILKSGEALLRILDDILIFSRLEAGGLQVEKSLVSGREVLEDIRALLAPLAVEKRLDFCLEVEKGAPEQLWNDGGRLRQVLLNLAGNAVKFTDRGSVTIGLRPAGRPEAPAVAFFVRDTGPGIPAGKLAHIFEPFAQADSSISRRYGGTGLGLSISRNLIALMGGSLEAVSDAGEGSEFLVTLPAELPAKLAPAGVNVPLVELDGTFAADHPLRILLVEDDGVNLKLMCMMLQNLGYEPFVAKDGVEAVEIHRRERPDCILMDLQMPQKDGLQATREIREREEASPGMGRAFIAALTANIVAENRRQCFEAGMDDYMNKPVKKMLLANTLAQAHGQARGASAAAGRR